MVIKFNKENELLSRKLQETQRNLDEINVSKEEMQENLKRAFMRGVCALNFEAMNILQEKKGLPEENLLSQTNGLTKKVMDINENLNNLMNPLEKGENSEKNDESQGEEDNEQQESMPNNKKIVFYQASKVKI